MISLDDLEAKAKAINCPETWDATDFTIDDGNDGEFIGAMSPTTALALIRIARCADTYAKVNIDTGEYNELLLALKEIDNA